MIWDKNTKRGKNQNERGYRLREILRFGKLFI